MLGLFGSLNLGARAMQVQQQGIEVAGHNMANVNNPAYARQRVAIQTSTAIATEHGQQGTGVDAQRIVQIRNVLLDGQIVTEGSITGSLEAQQQALEYAQSDLGQQIDRGATGAEGAAAASGTGKQHGIGDSISKFFTSLQSLSVQPSSSAERDGVLKSAQELANDFQQTDARLGQLTASLNEAVKGDVTQANGLLKDIAGLNEQISTAEILENGAANDLRDTRQQKLEQLSKLVKFDAVDTNNGSIDISIGGVTMVDGGNQRDQLEAYDDGNGKTLVRADGADTPLDIVGGSIHGAISTRDGAIQSMRDDLSSLATGMIAEVNRIHQGGFGLNGSTGLDFFQGTNAADIKVNRALIDDPTKLQASASATDAGNNAIVLDMAQLARDPQANFGGETFNQHYSHIVGNLGTALSNVNDSVTDQSVVTNMLSQQRDSVSAVSLDEEMTDLIKYQKAYQASAQLINTVNEMLDTVINLIR